MIARQLFPPLSQNPAEVFSQSSYLSPKKKRRFTEEPSSASPVTVKKTQRVLDEALSILPDQDAFTMPDYGRPEDPNAPKMPEAPIKPRPIDDFDFSPHFLTAKYAWGQITGAPHFKKIGEGHYHRVFAHPAQSVVHKLPRNGSLQENVKRTERMLADYKALRQAEKNGLFPANFHIARTMHNVPYAIVTQDKCDRMLETSDLQDPTIRTSLKELFRLGYEGLHNMDLSKKNVGIKNNQLVLIDFREDDVETAGTFKTNVEGFLRSFAEGDQEIYEYLDPRPYV